MPMEQAFTYPHARQADVVDDFHGTAVHDPYRWLEDPDSEETQAWVAAQNQHTAAFLSAVPARLKIQARLRELLNHPRYGVPHKEGEHYFFSKNDGLQNQSVLYMLATLDGTPTEVLDPNALSEDGTVALTNEAYSHDGRLLAYGASQSGSDWQTIRIRDVASRTDDVDVLHWCKFSGIAWRHDNSGFFYSRFPDPADEPEAEHGNHNQVYWHRRGTPQSADELIYARPDAKELAFNPKVSQDGAYLVLNVWHGTDPMNRIYYRRVESDEAVVRLLDEADARYVFIDNLGPRFLFHTDFEAPKGRIIAIDINAPERANWQEIIPEHDDVIDFVVTAGNRLVVGYKRDVHHELRCFEFDGTPAGTIELPTLGTINGLSGKRASHEIFVGFESFLYPPTSFRYDLQTGERTTFRTSGIPFDPAGYETKQIFYPSKDGTQVPLFITHKRGLVLDGHNPTLLYGYGGFNVTLMPFFSTSQIVWLEHGGVFAVASLRGGNEYGEAWHQAGMLERKQNVFDDFIAAAEWLIANGYTSNKRIAIQGGSNGGLLVAACMLQRPDLYGAVVCQVPVADMLRYHRFTIGRYWIGEYGNAESDPEQFRFMYAYSPLHNVKSDTTYPPILITSADTDDRVVPAHAKKFAATLQAASNGQNLVLLRVETKAGHGLGKPITKVIEEVSDIQACLFAVLTLPGGSA